MVRVSEVSYAPLNSVKFNLINGTHILRSDVVGTGTKTGLQSNPIVILTSPTLLVIKLFIVRQSS